MTEYVVSSKSVNGANRPISVFRSYISSEFFLERCYYFSGQEYVPAEVKAFRANVFGQLCAVGFWISVVTDSIDGPLLRFLHNILGTMTYVAEIALRVESGQLAFEASKFRIRSYLIS